VKREALRKESIVIFVSILLCSHPLWAGPSNAPANPPPPKGGVADLIPIAVSSCESVDAARSGAPTIREERVSGGLLK